jgi:hypothetical protein
MDNKKIFQWELVGFIFTVIIGSLLHFCFEWSGSFKPLAIICAVNESVWEHLKLGFWPFLIFSIIEYFAFGKENANFWIAKAVGLFIIPITITLGFYLYTSILGTHNLIIDIGLFILSILLAYTASYKILTSKKVYSNFSKASIGFIIIATILFSLLSYFPPKLNIFKDSQTGSYGIPENK